MFIAFYGFVSYFIVQRICNTISVFKDVVNITIFSEIYFRIQCTDDSS